MSIISELTYTQWAVSSSVDQIQTTIEHALHVRHQPAEVYTTLSRLIPSTLVLRHSLIDYFDYQRDNLFPRVHRIFGNDFEEVTAIKQSHILIIDSIDYFIEELPTPSQDNSQEYAPMKIAYLELLFEEFLFLYERQSALERSFYESLSTTLFPGGTMTD